MFKALSSSASSFSVIVSLPRVRRYLEACSTAYWPLARFLIGTGCRISEALAVEWDDIDPDQRVVRILRQMRKDSTSRRGRTRRAGQGVTKGKRYRIVHISPQLVAVLMQLREHQSRLAPVVGDDKVFRRIQSTGSSPPVFSQKALERRAMIADDLAAVADGRADWSQSDIAQRHGVSQQLVSIVRRTRREAVLVAISRDLVSRSWHQATLKAAQIGRPLRLHDLRHTAAARWLRTESLYFVQRQLGHANIQTTAKHYGHLEREHVYARLEHLDADLD